MKIKIKEMALPPEVGKAFILDNVLDYGAIRNIYNELTAIPYTFSQKSEQHSLIPNTRLAHHIEPDTEFSDVLVSAVDKIIKKVRKKDKLALPDDMQISEIYANTADAMSTMLPHTDRPKGCWTLLYFANYEWDIKWGGQTNFIDGSATEILGSVIPKPGRFVLFEADIVHEATPPTFYAPYRRFTIAFKMDILDIAEEPAANIVKEEYVTTNSCWN